MNRILNKNAKILADKPRRARKESIKQQKVVAAIRQKILSGAYPAGTQIPIQTELVKEFQLSSVTIQRAVHELKRQGFLTAKRRLGTFIAEKPPHLDNYALVFPQDPIRSTVWSNFYEGLRLAGDAINKAGKQIISFFYAIEEFERSEDYRHLVELVKNHQISGIIFAAPPHQLLETPLMREPGMPRVAISGSSGFDIPVVSQGGQSALAMAANYLASKKAKRIALFATQSSQVDEWLRGQSEWSRLGFATREQWSFAIPAQAARTAQSCARLLMDLPSASRPDGIIVMDDHLTEFVEAGLMGGGEKATRLVQIVALCNFPDRFAHQLPIKRLGCEVADYLRIGIEVIDAQRDGRKVRRQTFVQPHFGE